MFLPYLSMECVYVYRKLRNFYWILNLHKGVTENQHIEKHTSCVMKMHFLLLYIYIFRRFCPKNMSHLFDGCLQMYQEVRVGFVLLQLSHLTKKLKAVQFWIREGYLDAPAVALSLCLIRFDSKLFHYSISSKSNRGWMVWKKQSKYDQI